MIRNGISPSRNTALAEILPLPCPRPSYLRLPKPLRILHRLGKHLQHDLMATVHRQQQAPKTGMTGRQPLIATPILLHHKHHLSRPTDGQSITRGHKLQQPANLVRALGIGDEAPPQIGVVELRREGIGPGVQRVPEILDDGVRGRVAALVLGHLLELVRVDVGHALHERLQRARVEELERPGVDDGLEAPDEGVVLRFDGRAREVVDVVPDVEEPVRVGDHARACFRGGRPRGLGRSFRTRCVVVVVVVVVGALPRSGMQAGRLGAAEDIDAEVVGAAEDVLDVTIVFVPVSKGTQSSCELGPSICYVLYTVGLVVHDLHVQGDWEGEGQRHSIVDGQGGQYAQQLELVKRLQGVRLEP